MISGYPINVLKVKYGVLLISICISFSLTACGVGILLFHRDSKTVDIYRNNNSSTSYYSIKATTLSHCGCTYLSVDNYVNKRKTFNIYYNYNDRAGKTIYTFDKESKKRDTIRLVATTDTDFTVAFDSVDTEILKQIELIAMQQPKGIVYKIKIQDYKGYKRRFGF